MHVHTLASLMAASALLAFAVGEATAAEKRGTLQGQKTAPAASRTMGGSGVFNRNGIKNTKLTAGECTALGGKVTGSYYCLDKGQKTCAVVDPDGKITTMCIDEVSQ